MGFTDEWELAPFLPPFRISGRHVEIPHDWDRMLDPRLPPPMRELVAGEIAKIYNMHKKTQIFEQRSFETGDHRVWHTGARVPLHAWEAVARIRVRAEVEGGDLAGRSLRCRP